MSADLRIKSGDPADGPATFSRFVLPFAYAPKRHRPIKPSGDAAQRPQYRPIPNHEPGLADRRRYLTPETAAAIFDHALWLRLDEDPSSFDAAFADGQRFCLKVDKPRVVLFEFDADPGPSEGDLLRTGFLLLDVSFDTTAEPRLSHLLELNELFRYWQCPWAGHANEVSSDGPGSGYGRLLRAHLEDLRLATESAQHRHHSDPYLGRWQRFLEHPFADRRGKLWDFCPDWHEAARDAVLADRAPDFAWTPSPRAGSVGRSTPSSISAPGWIVHADQRAFVWTCAVLRDKEALKTAQGARGVQSPIELSAWVKLLNVDRPLSVKPTAFEKAWAEKHTYSRWLEFDSAYGFCSHAGAMLAGPVVEPPLWRHFSHMYFDQVLLLLYLRVGTFRFSRRLSEISMRARRDGTKDRFPKEFQRLRHAFALFTNLYQFPLLSNQQQAIEMYELARRHFDAQELFEEVKQEIQETDEFLSSKAQLDQANDANRLARVAALGASMGLALGVLQVRPGTAMGLVDPLVRLVYPAIEAYQERLDFLLRFSLLSLIFGILFWAGLRLVAKIGALVRRGDR